MMQIALYLIIIFCLAGLGIAVVGGVIDLLRSIKSFRKNKL